jgi:hypothetical protein
MTTPEMFEAMAAQLADVLDELPITEIESGNGRADSKSLIKKETKQMASGKKAKKSPDLKVVGGKVEAAAPAPDPKPAEINPFNLEELVVQPSYKVGVNMVTSAATIPVLEKPGPQTFFMTHPNPEYAQIFWGVKWHESEDPSRGEVYIMHPSVQAAMQEEKTFRRYKVYYCNSQTGRDNQNKPKINTR